MGFLSSFFSINPETLLTHRKVAREAKDRCIQLSISEKEVSLLNKLQLDRERFVYSRNELLVKIFNRFFQFYQDKTVNNPNATVGLAKSFFHERVTEHWASIPETEKAKMPDLGVAVHYGADIESSPDRLYLTASGKPFSSLSQEHQNEFKSVVNSYIKDVDDFFKKNLPKLLK